MADRSDLDPAVDSNADTNGASGLALSPDDPLRKWFQDLNDPGMAALMVSDPEKAKELMIQRGVAPPPHAQPYMDSNTGGSVMGYDPTQDPTRAVAPIRTTSDGKISGNLTAPANPDAPQVPKAAQVALASPLDPAEDVATPAESGLPRARPAEAPPADTDVSAKKKDYAGAFSDFSKSLAGVKPIQPPAVNAVGTPSVRSPTASGAPNIANILALAGQQQKANQLATLGRLLVAGKA